MTDGLRAAKGGEAMLRKGLRHMRQNAVAWLALFVAMGGTGAYAANEWTGANIVDGSLTGQDVFDNTIGGNDITNNNVAGTDIKDGSVGSADITPFSINEGDIASNVIDSRQINDGTLNDEDVGQGTFVHFEASIGVVPGNQCRVAEITGINVRGDHLLLTPNADDADARLIYGIRYRNGQETAQLTACNPYGIEITDPVSHFNLLVFDAQ